MREFTKKVEQRRQYSAWMGWVAFYCVMVMIHAAAH